MAMMEIGGANPGLGVPAQQEEARNLFEDPTEMPTVLDRLHNVFDTMVDRLSDIGDRIPTLPPTMDTRRLTVLALIGVGGGVGTLASAVAEAKPGAKSNNTIVVGQGMAGVRVGESEAQATRTLGKPIRANVPNPDLGGGSVSQEYPTVYVTYNQEGDVSVLDARSPKLKTDEGISLGSSRADVHKKYPGVMCIPAKPHFSLKCFMVESRDGQPVQTSFYFDSSNTVRDIEVFGS